MSQASLLLFEGNWYDPEKSPLLRAEWDDSEPNGLHAQPHWHVYPAGAGAGRHPPGIVFPMAPGDPIDFPQARGATEKETKDKPPRFHYAMAARWHQDGDSSCRCTLSERGLLLWLGGCITYIRRQLPHFSREELLG